MKFVIEIYGAKIAYFETLSVPLGTSFTVTAEDHAGEDWFFNNDNVASIDAAGNLVNIKATSVGRTDILLVKNGQIKAYFPLEVTEPVGEAASLNASVSVSPK
jgi:hypothetical protein